RADRERELRMAWPAPGERLAPDAFVELLMAERQARAAFEHAEQRAHPGYEALVPTAKELRAALLTAVEDLRGSVETVRARDDQWASDAARQIVAGRGRVWAELATETRDLLAQVADKARRASSHRVIGLENRAPDIVNGHANLLLRHLEVKGRVGVRL